MSRASQHQAAAQEEPVEAEEEGKITLVYSKVKGPNGLPVCSYHSEEEREKMDRVYRVKVTDVSAGPEQAGAERSVTLGSYQYPFPLDTEIDMYGFQVRQLRNSVIRQPKMTIVEGQIKALPDQYNVKSRFRVEVLDI